MKLLTLKWDYIWENAAFVCWKKNSCINFRYLFPQLYALWAIVDGFDSHQYRDFKLCVCILGQNAYLPTLIKYLYNYIINKRQELSTLYLFIYINIFIFLSKNVWLDCIDISYMMSFEYHVNISNSFINA